jgi:dihydrofolate reductase
VRRSARNFRYTRPVTLSTRSAVRSNHAGGTHAEDVLVHDDQRRRPEEELAKLKQQPGKDIVIPGSSTLTASLLRTGLLDELRIMVNPVILGQGRSLFAGAGVTKLKLLMTQQFSSGNVLLSYPPIRN